MNKSELPNTFLSYSRRQLYFAESVALHLQKEGLNIWFDLQQLKAGTVWSDELNNGIQESKTLILIVSKASLASKYVEVEWKGVAAKGGQIVLVIFESVKLPEELIGLPTFDFRTGFDKNISALTSYLNGEAEPRYDRIFSYNPLSWFTKTPASILKIWIAQFSLPILLILMLVLYRVFSPAQEMSVGNREFHGVLGALLLLMSFWYVIPFMRHKQTYKKVKRSVFFATLLLIPLFFIIAVSSSTKDFYFTNFRRVILDGIPLVLLAFNLYVYLFVLRRSIDFLRWMQPEDDLQKLRRRVHQPLISKEDFDVDIDSNEKSKSVLYTIHHDNADKPLANWIRKFFNEVGHQQVIVTEDPQHHIAILSNRSSTAWVQEVTQTYGGKLVFVVVSTIEFTKDLGDTGRYQWVDARQMEKRDILGLAKSLGDKTAWKREAAIESTPDKIDTLKMPSGIRLHMSLLVILGLFTIIIGTMEIISSILPAVNMDETILKNNHVFDSFLFLFIGVFSLWITVKGFIQRKISAPILYGLTLFNLILVIYKTVATAKLWLLLMVIIIPILILSVIDGRYWLPNFSKANIDEVGINKTIQRAFWKRRAKVVSIWIILFFGFYLWLESLKG